MPATEKERAILRLTISVRSECKALIFHLVPSPSVKCEMILSILGLRK